MITIPLVTVVSYLTRKGVDLACLEGEPYIYGDPEHPGRDWLSIGLLPVLLDPVLAPSNAELYLGRDAVCPAAMGWATRLLSVAREPASNAVWVGAKLVELWTVGCVESNHRWVWHSVIPAAEEWPEATYLPGSAPATPAARLRAVLEYEMGRDQ